LNTKENTNCDIRLTLFFTYDVSLKIWAETGLLQREIRLYQELQKQGVAVQFLTYGDHSDRQWESELGGIQLIPVYEHLPRPHSKILRLLQSFVIPWVVRNELRQSDLFKTNQIWGSWVAVLAKWLCWKPLLVRCGYEFYDFALKTGQSLGYRIFGFLISWVAYNSASLIHVATTADKNFVIEVFKVACSKIMVRPNWIDTEQFSCFPRSYTKCLLVVGRLTDQKNLKLLLQALSNTNIAINVIGEGELHDELLQAAQTFGINVRFLGWLPNDQLPAMYQSHPVYVICSRYEGNPKTLLEAMACGCAVIGTNVPGIREVIQHEKSGLLVEESVESLRSAILRLMDDEGLRSRLGEEARRQIIEENSLEAAIQQELKVYQELCPS